MTRAAAVTKLKGDLRKLKTAPIITTVLIYKINQWFGNTGNKPPQIPDDKVGLQLGSALEEQAGIGWENFMKGRVSTKWGETQVLNSKEVHRKNNRQKYKKWTEELIKRIW